MKIRLRLSQESIQEAREQLSSIDGFLKDKIRQLVEELANEGVQIAESNTGEYRDAIKFEVNVEDTATGSIATITMSDKYKIIREWRYRGGNKQAEVSPSMMAEYGSGKYAVDGHRGTFPNQKHAWENEWHWTTLDNVHHKSSGEQPLRPMYLAYTKLNDSGTVLEVAKRVFSG